MKISFCTTCMGRLYHLKETLPANVEANKDYPEVEFVVLDYNSPDGLDEWIQAFVKDRNLQGRVSYYRERSAKFFDPRHAKNVAHLLASGDVLVNLDADNFTGAGYAAKVAQVFRDNPRCFGRIGVTLPKCEQRVGNEIFPVYSGMSGRVLIRRTDFLLLRGYDESFTGWGAEDPDLTTRAGRIGLHGVPIESPGEGAIDHSDEERIKNFQMGGKDRFTTNAVNWKRSMARPAGAIVNPDGYGRALVIDGFTGVARQAGVGRA